jgi:hypothetical protein
VAGESTELSRSGHGYSVTRRDRCLPPDVASCRPHVHGSCQFIAYVFSCMQKWHRTCTFPWLHMSLLQNKQWATKCYSPQTLKYKHFPSAFKNNSHMRCQSSCEHAKLFFGIMHAWANCKKHAEGHIDALAREYYHPQNFRYGVRNKTWKCAPVWSTYISKSVHCAFTYLISPDVS